MRTNFSDRAFNAAGPRLWICLPTDLRQPDLSYSRFRQSLKTFLFGHWDSVNLPFNCTLEIVGSVNLATESRTHCTIAPAYMNIHEPYHLISFISMDLGGVVPLPCM